MIEVGAMSPLAGDWEDGSFVASSVKAGCSNGDIGRMGCKERAAYEL